jgi:hypothetical protein
MAPEDLEHLCGFISRFAEEEGYKDEDARTVCAAIRTGEYKDLTEEQAFVGWDALTCYNAKKPLSQELYLIFGQLESLWQVDGWLV